MPATAGGGSRPRPEETPSSQATNKFTADTGMTPMLWMGETSGVSSPKPFASRSVRRTLLTPRRAIPGHAIAVVRAACGQGEKEATLRLNAGTKTTGRREEGDDYTCHVGTKTNRHMCRRGRLHHGLPTRHRQVLGGVLIWAQMPADSELVITITKSWCGGVADSRPTGLHTLDTRTHTHTHTHTYYNSTCDGAHARAHLMLSYELY